MGKKHEHTGCKGKPGDDLNDRCPICVTDNDLRFSHVLAMEVELPGVEVTMYCGRWKGSFFWKY